MHAQQAGRLQQSSSTRAPDDNSSSREDSIRVMMVSAEIHTQGKGYRTIRWISISSFVVLRVF